MSMKLQLCDFVTDEAQEHHSCLCLLDIDCKIHHLFCFVELVNSDLELSFCTGTKSDIACKQQRN